MDQQPTSPPATAPVAKKLWKTVRIVFLMLRKKISKSKLLLELHHILTKRGKILEEAIENLMFHHHSSTFGCRSNDAHLSYITPTDYEFSCSNSPAFPFHKRSKKHHSRHFSPAHSNGDITTVTAVQTILEMLNNEVTEASPVLPGFGFGRSPMVRQLRITDSPYSLKDVEENSQVDKEAEEFIERFYEQLRLQKNLSTREARKQNTRARCSS